MRPSTDTRENRGFASEIKFLVDRPTGHRIRDWARARLEPDPYGEGPFGDEYRTTSLYFDTADFDVFYRRGSYGRSKYRIRRYDGEAVVFLERKLRRATRLTKRRTVVPLHALTHLENHGGVWPGAWFEQRLLVRGLLPVCQISYQRLARVAMRDNGPIRVTLDDNIRALPQTHLAFGGHDAVAVRPHKMVLELKFRGTAPAIFKQLVEEFALTPARVSKYRMTVGALGLIPEEAARTPVLLSCPA